MGTSREARGESVLTPMTPYANANGDSGTSLRRLHRLTFARAGGDGQMRTLAAITLVLQQLERRHIKLELISSWHWTHSGNATPRLQQHATTTACMFVDSPAWPRCSVTATHNCVIRLTPHKRMHPLQVQAACWTVRLCGWV